MSSVPCLGEQPVVVGVQLGELALALAALALQRLGPRRVVRGGDHLELAAVDALDTPPSSTAGLPRKSWRRSVSWSMRSSSSARRSARGERDEERVDARVERVVAQQARAEVGDGVRPRARRTARRSASSTWRAQHVGRGRGARHEQDVLRRHALVGEPREPLDEHPRLAGSRAAHHQQRPARVRRRRGAARRSAGRGAAARAYRMSEWRAPRRHSRRTGSARAAGRRRACARSSRDHPTSRERVEETGERGEGGDQTLVIDQQAEDGVFRELERLHDRGARFRAVSEERGVVDFGSDDVVVVIDPIDGSLNAKRGMTARRHLDRGRRPARRWPTSSSASSPTSGPARSGRPARGEGAASTARRCPSRRPSGATATASSRSSRSSPPTRAGSRRGMARPARRTSTASARSARWRSRSARSRSRAWTGWRRCGARARSTAPRRQLIVRESGGVVAFPGCDDSSRAAGPRAARPVVAARTSEGARGPRHARRLAGR